MSLSRFARRCAVRITLATALLALVVQPTAGAAEETDAVAAGSGGAGSAVVDAAPIVEEAAEVDPAATTGQDMADAEPADAPSAEPEPTTAVTAVDEQSTIEETDDPGEAPAAAEASADDTGERAATDATKLSPGCAPSDRSGSITGVTLSETVVAATDIVEVSFTGYLPQGGCEDDFVRLGLPEELSGLTGSFPVRAPDGTLIGTMVVSAGAAVITFNDYLEDHVEVSFRGRLEAQVRVSVEPDTAYDLRWSAGDEVFITPITTSPCPDCGPEDVRVRKFAEYHDGPPPYIRFAISSTATQSANESVVFTDEVDSGQQIQCDQVSMLMGTTLDNWGKVQFTDTWTDFTLESCSATDLRVSLTASAVGQYFRLVGRATPTAVQDRYSDSATVTQAGVLTGVAAFAELSEGDASGEGTLRKPSVHIEKWSTEDGPVLGDYDDKHKMLGPNADERITFTIRNNGNEALDDVVVSDRTTAGTGVVRGMTCDFSDLGGPSTGTAWSGPFRIDDSFRCKGRLPALGADARHTDRAKVEAIGRATGTPVKDTDDWNAKTRDRDLPAPDVDIEKWSTVDGPRAGDFDDSYKQVVAGAPEALSFKITNRGDEALVDLRVGDEVLEGSATVDGLTCDFSAVGGPATGTRWAGPLKVGETFRCRATLGGLGTADTHIDRAIVTATGSESGGPTRDTDDWGASSRELPLTGGPAPEPLGPTGPLLPLVGTSPTVAPITGLAVLLMVSGIWLLRRRASV
jgi:hypothetical protein